MMRQKARNGNASTVNHTDATEKRSHAAQRNITSQELDSTWICFDSHNQKCMRLSEFASQDATAKLCAADGKGVTLWWVG